MACPLPVVFYYLRRFVSLFVITCKKKKIASMLIEQFVCLLVCFKVSPCALSYSKKHCEVLFHSSDKFVGQESRPRN